MTVLTHFSSPRGPALKTNLLPKLGEGGNLWRLSSLDYGQPDTATVVALLQAVG